MATKGERCDHCQLKFQFRWDRQEVWLFKCDHIFHTSCIQATQGQCARCFNELDAFRKFQPCLVSTIAFGDNTVFVLPYRVNFVDEAPVYGCEARPSQELVKNNYRL